MQARYSVVNLSDINTFELIYLARLAKTALVIHTSDIVVVIAELSIDRLNEAELTPAAHFHRIFLRTVHHWVLRGIVPLGLVVRHDASVSTRVDRCESRAHPHHHLRRLRARVH